MCVRVCALAHHAEIVVHGQIERVDHLVEHLAVLAGQARHHPEATPPMEFQYDRSHLDGLWAGAEADEEGPHEPYPAVGMVVVGLCMGDVVVVVGGSVVVVVGSVVVVGGDSVVEVVDVGGTVVVVVGGW